MWIFRLKCIWCQMKEFYLSVLMGLHRIPYKFNIFCHFWCKSDFCHGRDCMAVGFITTYAISAYHHLCCKFEPHSGELYSIQHYGIKCVSDLWQVDSFLWVLRFPPPIKLDCHNITEILLKVKLNTVSLNDREYEIPYKFNIFCHFWCKSDFCSYRC